MIRVRFPVAAPTKGNLMRIEIRSGEGGEDAAQFAKEFGTAIESIARRSNAPLTVVAPGVYEIGSSLH